MLPVFLLLLGLGCSEYDLFQRERPGEPDDDAPSQDTALGTVDRGPPGETGDSAPTPDEPRPPAAGDLAIVELMIDPAAVADELGEWVELLNTSGAVLDLAGHHLADEGVDDAEITATSADSLLVQPGARLVLCAERQASRNGGAGCQGDYFYQEYGGGLALANTGDELLLRSPDGLVIDRVAYGDSSVPTGASLGTAPGASDATANDRADNWCAQRSAMSGGDAGTPGRANDDCG